MRVAERAHPGGQLIRVRDVMEGDAHLEFPNPAWQNAPRWEEQMRDAFRDLVEYHMFLQPPNPHP